MIPDGVMFNAYPDSCGGSLAATVRMLRRDEFAGVFRYFYVLPSMFRSDLDRGFSVVSYDLNTELVQPEDLASLEELGIELKLDFVLNHLSVRSSEFLDLLENGDDSRYVDAFIDWNKFWEGHGTIGPEGYVVPEERYLSKLFMRKPGLPILRVPFPDGSYRFYWNTFYQSVSVTPPNPEQLTAIEGIDESNAPTIAGVIRTAIETGTPVREAAFGRYSALAEAVSSYVDRRCTSYLGQMDLNARSKIVWAFYEATFERLASYGARVVRLDAFAYLHKEIGASNFFNEPGTWEHLERIRGIADRYEIVLLPEIHSKYEDATHVKLAQRGYSFYDFFFPGLVIDAIESRSAERLAEWIAQIDERGFDTVNMLGCHDGIPVLDVKGILDDATIDGMIELITERGGRVKDLYGADGSKISYYQVNATFFSALGEDPRKLLVARAIQIFTPGIPEVWYLDIFAGTNDIEAADRGGHKEINRTNLTEEEIEERIALPIVRSQLELLRFRNTFPAFGPGADLAIDRDDPRRLRLAWRRGGHRATLEADLATCDFSIAFSDEDGEHTLDVGVKG